ncbi:MAG: serine hydrolase [Burkholderiaceae bacterium]|jgi:CubicO group peptidase (beta-lactamase class C family)|nr:serine hydrolase [Burkholderiales bacterium]MCZ8339851.1 serine hydrolase [Burkholderiaceae bacterium]
MIRTAPAPTGAAAAPREMTVQDLLRHTSGLTYAPFGRSAVKDEYAKADINPGLRQLPFDLSEMASRLGKMPLAFAPGTTWDYSISTDVLGLVVDSLRFTQMLLNGGELDGVRIVSRKTIEYMSSDHLGPIGRGPAYLPGPGHGFGLGFAVRNGSGESAWYGSPGDYYRGGCAGTAFWVDPKERLVAVWMMQGPGPGGAPPPPQAGRSSSKRDPAARTPGSNTVGG